MKNLDLEYLMEANKSGDNSLHDWFNKSKASDGTKGWVQLGGKFAGKPCARQPGQTSTPKCGSSKMKRNLSKKEEERAFRRKNRQDPNQPNKSGGAKPTNVKTEGKTYNEFMLKEAQDKTKPNAAPHTVAATIKTPNKGGKGLDVMKGFAGRFDPSQLGRSGRLEI